jgi:uncharacterized membrane protein
MEIAGLPIHPLVVHAVVVFAPLAAVAGLLYAAIPRWRWALRWPLVVCTLIAVGGAFVATISGQSLLEARNLGQLPAVQSHRTAGLRLRNVLVVFTLVSLLSAWRMGGPSALASGRGARDQHGLADLVLGTLLVLGSLAVLFAAVLAGDSGARSLWG